MTLDGVRSKALHSSTALGRASVLARSTMTDSNVPPVEICSDTVLEQAFLSANDEDAERPVDNDPAVLNGLS